MPERAIRTACFASGKAVRAAIIVVCSSIITGAKVTLICGAVSISWLSRPCSSISRAISLAAWIAVVKFPLSSAFVRIARTRDLVYRYCWLMFQGVAVDAVLREKNVRCRASLGSINRHCSGLLQTQARSPTRPCLRGPVPVPYLWAHVHMNTISICI
jgi:hypothetical protein